MYRCLLKRYWTPSFHYESVNGGDEIKISIARSQRRIGKTGAVCMHDGEQVVAVFDVHRAGLRTVYDEVAHFVELAHRWRRRCPGYARAEASEVDCKT